MQALVRPHMLTNALKIEGYQGRVKGHGGNCLDGLPLNWSSGRGGEKLIVCLKCT